PVIFSDERSRQALIPDSLFVIGRTTLSRTVNHYIKESPKVIVIDPRAENIDSARSADLVLHQLPKISSVVTRDDQWFATWEKYELLATQAVSSLTEWNEPSALAQIVKEIEGDSALFVSSSRPIRDIESFAQPRSGVTTYANRGLAGIDGNISTAMGIASCHDETIAIMGDLAFLHDIGALANPTVDALTIIVIDNNGGGIFSTLRHIIKRSAK
ncbi:MAG: 2-succinyl-5-enolpyruvyl-6-hydroxy-3-cyclohexene-1-carboxylate synthase, partial [Actinobacteria bacterium]|nr:2-succinyl-5-enolpyruvyl-6-hydroxy-3-cyclohexene-1-carboxylate synthase [Actinomycetota bacterium]